MMEGMPPLIVNKQIGRGTIAPLGWMPAPRGRAHLVALLLPLAVEALAAHVGAVRQYLGVLVVDLKRNKPPLAQSGNENEMKWMRLSNTKGWGARALQCRYGRSHRCRVWV
jgi:hypothetical protein